MKTPTIPCPKCNGTGNCELGPELMEVLVILRKLKVAPVQPILERVDANVTYPAINNRLERLRELGLVTRQRHGHFWWYSAVRPPDDKRYVVNSACPPAFGGRKCYSSNLKK